MAVPRASSLGPGVQVNIVLKKDQPTGKLTTGRIQDLLSRGDHPRGIKVRLQDGQIGRVQSLAVNGAAGDPNSSSQQNQPLFSNPSQSKHYVFQEDYRTTAAEIPTTERSLEDYIKVKPARKKGKTSKSASSNIDHSEPSTPIDPQVVLEAEFSTVDSSLIAAILNDTNDLETARTTLHSLAQA